MLLVMLLSLVGMPVAVSAAWLPIQLPASAGKAAVDDPGFGPLSPCGRPGWGSWLQPDPALSISV